MGLIADIVRNAFTPPVPVAASSMWTGGNSGPQTYAQFARKGYAGNEIVFSAIELLASSAAEPHITGRRWRRESPSIRAEETRLAARGHSLIEINASLIRNGFILQVPDHPLVRLLNAPNPFMSRGQCWSTVVMDRYLGGNAYLLKARYQDGPFKGAVGELWRLRPDRIRIVPDKETFCKYEYTIPGTTAITFEHRDVMHFKTRNPLDDYYGMPPLLTISKRIDIDNFMAGFLQGFFERGGTGPGSILTVKQKLSEQSKTDIRDRFHKQFGGPGGWHEMMILDQAESTYQQMGLNRGLRDALPAELDHMSEARIAMVFGIPGSILGLLIGYESSSYANKRADWQVLWDVTMAPLLCDLDDVLNLSMVPEFGGIDEVYFDLSDIKALQEDVDKLHDRARKNFQVGGWSFEEFRDATGMDPNPTEGTFFVIAGSSPTAIENIIGEEAAGEVQSLALNGAQITSLLEVLIQVTSKLLSPETAKAMLQASFPALTDDLINRMVDNAADFTPPPVAPPMPALPEPAPEAVVEARCPSCNHKEGENVNIGAELHCRKCRETFVVKV